MDYVNGRLPHLWIVIISSPWQPSKQDFYLFAILCLCGITVADFLFHAGFYSSVTDTCILILVTRIFLLDSSKSNTLCKPLQIILDNFLPLFYFWKHIQVIGTNWKKNDKQEMNVRYTKRISTIFSINFMLQ